MIDLVTGATGFTGSAVVRALVERGESEVVALVRPSSDTAELQRLGVECRTTDIRDLDSVTRSFGRPRRVFHVAAAFRTEHAELDEFQRVNVDATRNLLICAAEAGVERFVHFSTVGVQGAIDDPPAGEGYRYQPGDHYQRTKLEGELAAREFAERGLPVCIVRPVGIYGPGDRRFRKLFRPISRGRFVMIGSGETLYHLTYIDDLVAGILLAAGHPAALGEVFTIAGPRYTTLNELVASIANALGVRPPRLRIPYRPIYLASVACERACKAVGIEPPLYPRRVEFFSKDRAFDISKSRRVLGFEPKVDLEEGLRRTAEWYRAEGLL
jgi:nucleoside-diphosphate-sugar epimerase